MNKKYKYLFIAIETICLLLIAGTFAWLSYRSNDTAMVLTIGDINNVEITLFPYQVKTEISPVNSYQGQQYVDVTATNSSSRYMNYTLFYDINSIDSVLKSNDFKYTIERSIDNGSSYTEYKTGNFSTANTTDNFVILNEDIPNNKVYKYRVYVWLDGTNNEQSEVQGAIFKADLRAEILGEAKAYLVDTSGNTSFYKEDTYREKIVSASFVNYVDTSNAVETYDMGVNSNRPVIAWLENGTDADTYNLYIGSNYKIYGTILKETFRALTNLSNINFSNLDTSEATVMNRMFASCSKLSSIDLSSFNTSNVIDMAAMLAGCSSLTSLDLSSFDTSKVTNMSQMFQESNSLISLDLTNFDTSNVTTMMAMFSGCLSLEVVNVSSFDTSKVENMYMMFGKNNGTMSLKNIIGIEDFNTSNVTDMGGMFQHCEYLTSLDLSHWDTSNVTSFWSIFNSCNSLTSLNLSNWDTSKGTSMRGLFSGCSSLVTIDISSFNTSNVTNMSGMFEKCTNLETIYVSNKWNTGNVTTSTAMFNKDTKLPNYNSSVTDKTNAHYNTGGYLTLKASN